MPAMLRYGKDLSIFTQSGKIPYELNKCTAFVRGVGWGGGGGLKYSNRG